MRRWVEKAKTVLIGGLVLVIIGMYISGFRISNELRQSEKYVRSQTHRIEILEDQLAISSEDIKRIDALETQIQQVINFKFKYQNLPQRQEGGKGGSDKSALESKSVKEELEGSEPDTATRISQIELLLSELKEDSEQWESLPTLWPLNRRDAYISSNYGNRTNPISGKKQFHSGVDIVSPKGTSVYAAAKGKVVFADRAEGLGKEVIIDHGNGYRTVYGHNNKLLVKKGQTVKRGDKIAEVGSTGLSTGPHLHYEILFESKCQNPNRYMIHRDSSESPYRYAATQKPAPKLAEKK